MCMFRIRHGKINADLELTALKIFDWHTLNNGTKDNLKYIEKTRKRMGIYASGIYVGGIVYLDELINSVEDLCYIGLRTTRDPKTLCKQFVRYDDIKRQILAVINASKGEKPYWSKDTSKVAKAALTRAEELIREEANGMLKYCKEPTTKSLVDLFLTEKRSD